ncbi:MAG: MaoC family dehydratase N-terminal domain-containing protein, partial [Planctomycetales bacterium]|nr:MaoC family dehydratase N-terminal domain-containing protein [Planctomycetales bacterium]
TYQACPNTEIEIDKGKPLSKPVPAPATKPDSDSLLSHIRIVETIPRSFCTRKDPMMQRLHFDELQIGDRWESHARTITETDVVNFACLTGDFDPLHVDHESAAKAPFGRPVAHGLLGLAYLAGLGTHAPNVHTIAFLGIRDWSFRKPVFVGDTVHAVTRVVAVAPSGRRTGHVTWHRELVNQNGEVVQSGTFETAVATAVSQSIRISRQAA